MILPSIPQGNVVTIQWTFFLIGIYWQLAVCTSEF